MFNPSCYQKLFCQNIFALIVDFLLIDYDWVDSVGNEVGLSDKSSDNTVPGKNSKVVLDESKR